ncbi:MAG: hypothetical protein ABI142_11090 [Bryocella sp.]
MKTFPVLLLAASVSALTLAGCHVTDHGKKGNVDISTPFGGMHVQTDNDVSSMTGLSIYPGAKPVKDRGSSHDSANVNLSFGSFHLDVKAASYQSADPPEKVLAFYRNDMAKYGDVIECQNDKPIGTPSRTSQGLTCDEHNRNEIHVERDDHHHNVELRTGSKHKQRIVSVEPKDGGTRLGLVLLNLPHGSGNDKGTTE